MEAAGFDYNMAKLALKKHGGDIMKAAEDLLENGGIIEGEMSSDEGEISADFASDLVDSDFLVLRRRTEKDPKAKKG